MNAIHRFGLNAQILGHSHRYPAGATFTCLDCNTVWQEHELSPDGTCGNPTCLGPVLASHAPQSLCSCLERSRAEDLGEEMQRKNEGSAERGEVGT